MGRGGGVSGQKVTLRLAANIISNAMNIHFIFRLQCCTALKFTNQSRPAQVSPFLILSIFRAVRCFYSAYSHVMLTHTWGYEQPQETQGQNPENDDYILR